MIMEPAHAIDKAAQILGTSVGKLAAKLRVTKAAASQWKTPGRKVPVRHCVAIEQMTNGLVTRQELRPDDWHLIWPELAAQSASEASAHG